ncbi:hypothetical protein D3C76_839550 [compost metagenome]
MCNQALLAKLSGGVHRQALRPVHQHVCTATVQPERLDHLLTSQFQQVENGAAVGDETFETALNGRLIGVGRQLQKLLERRGRVIVHRGSPANEIMAPRCGGESECDGLLVVFTPNAASQLPVINDRTDER